MHFWQSVIEALLPRRCAVCESVSRGELFCGGCQQGICWDVGHHHDQTQVQADLVYAGTVQQAIQQAKFRPDQTCAEALVLYWSQSRRGQLCRKDLFAGVEAVCFVPLHWRRRVQRGFDLPALIARALANRLKVPILDILRCKRLDKPLSLSGSRKQRVVATRGRYELRLRGDCIVGKQVVLVDDVVTTGSTLTAAAHVLQEAGATVHRFALARAQVSQRQLQS